MTDLAAQKRLAADILDVGEGRIWLDPAAQSDISEAITRQDVRDLIDSGSIQTEEASGNSRGRARERAAKQAYGHQTGPGSRRGTAGARQNSKQDWQNQIRAQRRTLRELRDDGSLSATQYRELYDMAKGGEFQDVRRLKNYIDEQYGDT